MQKGHDPAAIADDLFRRESARLVASLTRVFGPGNIDLVEDVVQEALEAALQAWKFRLPDNPTAWLSRVARNRAVDAIRHQSTQRKYAQEHASQLDSGWSRSSTIDEALIEDAADENQLRMMFSLCHEDLSAATHVTLILRFLCGLSNRELAKAYLVTEDTIKKRVMRGRAKLRELGSLPVVNSSNARQLDSVLNALYLLFNEGYHGSHPISPTRTLLCEEAMRLCLLFIRTLPTVQPHAHALMALMYFHYARIDSRLDERGKIVPLERQDRSAWDQDAVARGIEQLGLSSTGARLSRYHLEAGIACKHSMAACFADIDWAGILELYDLLFELNPNPVVQLTRATVRAYAGDIESASRELEALACDEALQGYPFYWAARAQVYALNGETNAARLAFERAAELARGPTERDAWDQRTIELSELQSVHGESSANKNLARSEGR